MQSAYKYTFHIERTLSPFTLLKNQCIFTMITRDEFSPSLHCPLSLIVGSEQHRVHRQHGHHTDHLCATTMLLCTQDSLCVCGVCVCVLSTNTFQLVFRSTLSWKLGEVSVRKMECLFCSVLTDPLSDQGQRSSKQPNGETWSLLMTLPL